MKRILIFDSNIDGHHSDYLAFLVKYWSESCFLAELFVVTNKDFRIKYTQIESNHWPENVKMVGIEEEDLNKIIELRGIKRSLIEWKLVKKFTKELRIDSLLLMYFDLFQFALFFEKTISCKIYGIYFRPNFYYNIPISNIKSKIRQIVKKVLFLSIIKKRFIENIFCLDTSISIFFQKCHFNNKLSPICDPVKVYKINNQDLIEARLQYKIPIHKTVFLLFGSLDERKGCLELLDGLSLLSEDNLKNIVILLVGTIPDYYKKAIEEKMQKINNSVEIICHFSEVRGKNIQILFEISDYVLTLYQQHIGMSSIVIRACVAEKPIISSNYGLVGEIVKSRQLGWVLDASSPSQIANAIKKSIAKKISHSLENQKEIANNNSDILFAQTIFNKIT